MNQIKEYNDLGFGLQNNLGEQLQNKILRIQEKNQLERDSSSDSSDEDNIQYYEKFLKSLKDENKNQNHSDSKNQIKKNNHEKNKIKIRHFNSKDFQKKKNNDNDLNNFFKMRPKSMAKNFMKNKLSIEDSPRKKNLGESAFNFNYKKNGHNKFMLNYHSKNKISEVDESVISNQIKNEKNNVVAYCSKGMKQTLLLNENPHLISQKKKIIENNNNQNINDTINNNSLSENKKTLKINNKNEKKEFKKSNNITNPYTKDTEENLYSKNDNSNINKNDTSKFEYTLPIKKKKKLFCCCIPIG